MTEVVLVKIEVDCCESVESNVRKDLDLSVLSIYSILGLIITLFCDKSTTFRHGRCKSVSGKLVRRLEDSLTSLGENIRLTHYA